MTTSGARTSDEPWSPVLGRSASRPTTASRPSAARSSGSSGRSPTGSLRSSTIDRPATSRASARCPAEATTSGSGAGVSSPAANRSWVATIRPAARSASARSSWPEASAAGRVRARCWANGISRSSPAATEPTGSRRPQMKSDMTKPAKPHSSRRISVSRVRFCPHHSPSTELYALITAVTPASTTARKCGR